MASGRFFIRWTWADGFIERVEAGGGKNPEKTSLSDRQSQCMHVFQC